MDSKLNIKEIPAADTIAAISTARQNAAIGVTRMSGPLAIELADRVFHAQNGRTLADTPSSRAVYGTVTDGEKPVDTVIATVFRAPHSFTGEDTVEFSCHGGVFVLSAVLELLFRTGARPAEAGEFSRRAFLNGKLDLVQAEAVIDLIEAKSQKSASIASCGVGGGLSKKITAVRQTLVEAAGHIMAFIDYPDEDFDDLSREVLLKTLAAVTGKLESLLATYPLGCAVKDGIATAILGTPNVGKSSVMNALAGYEKSIVTALPGTTRDVLEETIRIGDYLLNLHDTAGIRPAADEAEAIGVSRSKERAQSAQLLLFIFDGSRPLSDEDRSILSLQGETPSLAVINKMDLPLRIERDEIYSLFNDVVEISAQTGAGMEDLRLELQRYCAWGLPQAEEDEIITNVRQRDCLARARESVCAAKETVCAGFSVDMAEIDIRNAIEVLGELTGESAGQDILNHIFSRFCVGK